MIKQLLSRREVSLFIFLCFFYFSASAQVPISALNATYTQDFNSLANTGTSTALPAGWLISETGTSASADGLYAAGTGSSNAGNMYSFGAAGSTDRALGGLLSGTLTPTLGASFVNNTSTTLTSIAITYTGEQWRLGTINRADSLLFQYSTTASSLLSGTWISVSPLNFGSPVTGPTIGALNGNAAANRQTLTVTLAGLSIAPGSTFWIRWNDFNAAGADDGLAVDDFSLTAFGEITTPIPTLTVSPGTLNFGETVSGSVSVRSFTLTGENLTDEVTASATGAGFTISKDSISFDTLVTLSLAELASSQKIFVNFTPTTFGSATGSVLVKSSGATSQTVTLTGSVVNPFEQNFNTCASSLPGGWTQYSVAGAQTWACTTFGRTGNAVQINGFSGSALLNTDWLISPALNLTGFTYPLLSYWSRTRFTGPSLKLLVSTNYAGSGDPSLATWTELNGQFPLINSDVWTEASNINLEAFKQSEVYIAFLYTSSPADEAARWTLDDFTVINSATPPPPRLTTSITPLTDVYFESALGTPSPVKSISFSISNAADDLVISVPAPFQIAKDSNSFASMVTYTVAELASAKTVLIRSLPTSEGAFAGKLTFSSGVISSTQAYLTASSISTDKTFDVVSMNVEWFGHPSNGPSDNYLQARNLRSLIQRLDADVFTFQEISDIQLFADSVVAQLPGYEYVYSTYVSNPETNDPYAQKLVTVYKTATVTKLNAKALLTGVNVNALPNYPDPDPTRFWASGRLPFLLDAQVTIQGVSKRIAIVNIHARANSGADVSRYQMRAYDVKVLKDTLDTYYANIPVLIQGDYNDDVDSTVAPIPSPLISSYQPYVLDSTNYKVITQVLSEAGLRSYITESNVIDHIAMTNELFADHLGGSTRMDYALNYITNYQNTLSDHLPVTTRFKFSSIPPTVSIATTPATNTTVVKNTTIVITAIAADADGSISKVEFYNGNILLATDTTSPYSYTIPQASVGYYSLAAVAYDNTDAQTRSDSSLITVVEPGVYGPACVIPGKTYTYELLIDPSTVKKVNWWVNGSATVVPDPANNRKVQVTFSQYNKSTVQLTAGINYVASPWYTQLNTSVKVGGCTPPDTTTSPTGIKGTACAAVGQVYEFELLTNPALAVSNVTWWVNGSATIVIDPLNNKKVKVVFSQYNPGAIQLSAGVTYTSSPWYESFAKTVQIGSCATASRIGTELPASVLMAYPNPTSGKVIVAMGTHTPETTTLRLFDALGKECLVQKKNVTSTNVELDMQTLAPGLYLLRAESADKTESLRIIKK